MIAKRTIISLLLLCAFIGLAASSGQCQVSSTTDEFNAYVRTFPECRMSGSATAFQNEIQIINQVFDFDDNFDKSGLDRAALTQYCQEVQNCKTQLSTCDTEMKEFIDNAGAALCQNGQAMSKELDDALDTLSKANCMLFKPPVGLRPDGCSLTEDDRVDPSTYLASVQRQNKKRSAISRCMSRHALAQPESCSVDVRAAYATVNAASRRLENINASFNQYTSFSKPVLSEAQTTLGLRGFGHIYRNGEKLETCTSILGSHVLLWNTYLRIDGTISEMEPMSGKGLLTGLLIQFSDDAGRIMDSYMTDVLQGSLSTQTSQTQAARSSTIQLENLGDNHIVLSHPGIDARISIRANEQSLSIVISLPTSLLDLESLGLLVEGCQTYSGMVVDNVEATATTECEDECTAVAAVDKVYYNECSYDCTQGVDYYVTIYSKAGKEDEAVKPVEEDVSKATRITVSCLLVVLVTIITL